MSSALYNYEKLKNLIPLHFNAIVNSDSTYRNIKVKFISDIKSPRRFERLKTINDLIAILEKRNCLSETYIKPLEIINKDLGEPVDISQAIQNHRGELHNGNTSKKKNINNALKNGLGKSYRDFARYSGIEESELDIIILNHSNDVSSQIWKILETFESKFLNDDEYFKTLCVILKMCHRNDLFKKVDKIWQS